LLDESLILIIAAGAACLVFFAGLCTVGASLYFFTKQRSRTVAGVPAWLLALAVGLFLTFIIPGAIIFMAAYLIATQTPPPVVTCYAPMPPSAGAIAPAAGALLGRTKLLEELRDQGKVPGEVYDRVRRSR
jgi:hypothetical protein